MYKTQQVKLNIGGEEYGFLLEQCRLSNLFYNRIVYDIRQQYFGWNQDYYEWWQGDTLRQSRKDKRVPSAFISYAKLCKVYGGDPLYAEIGGQVAQQCIKQVIESFISYNKLVDAYWNGNVSDQPRLPSYRQSGLNQISFPAQGVTLDRDSGMCKLSLPKVAKPVLKGEGLSELWINGGYGFDVDRLVEVTVLPKSGSLYVNYVYTADPVVVDVDPSQALGIDHGGSNWLTCVTTLAKSFIIDGKPLRSINQGYDRQVAKYKAGKSEFYWDDELDRITEKRNNQMRDATNKAARFIVNHCIANGIGTIVFGWNKDQKRGINMGRKQNQQFSKIPTGKLKTRLSQLCEEYGLMFVENEESYTSKASFLDNDLIPVFGEKPKTWKPSGQRVLRGMYKSADGHFINADCNGAANLLSKVAVQLGLNLTPLVEAGRDALNRPKRYDPFSSLSSLYRSKAQARFQPA